MLRNNFNKKKKLKGRPRLSRLYPQSTKDICNEANEDTGNKHYATSCFEGAEGKRGNFSLCSQICRHGGRWKVPYRTGRRCWGTGEAPEGSRGSAGSWRVPGRWARAERVMTRTGTLGTGSAAPGPAQAAPAPSHLGAQVRRWRERFSPRGNAAAVPPHPSRPRVTPRMSPPVFTALPRPLRPRGGRTPSGPSAPTGR